MLLLILLQQEVLLKQQFTSRQLASQKTLLLSSLYNEIICLISYCIFAG